ncbi:MAG: hypothetical protein II214_01175 [Alistipes sp.]|nr:hypothetical protein [Alistipes sp.]
MNLKRIVVSLMLCAVTCGVASAKNFDLRNDKVKVVVGKGGELVELVNLTTGHNYASGGYLWRMYYDTHDEQEIEVIGGENKPQVAYDGKSIVLNYDKIVVRGEKVNMSLRLTVTLDGENVRFASEVKNDVAHTVIRELQYPLVRNAQLPADHKLILAANGGSCYENPVKTIMAKSNKIPYRTPAQIFRQFDLHYGGSASMNCYILSGEKQGLYVGSHDEKIQDTWHGMRVYADKNGAFTEAEFGLFKYPQCFAGEKWSNDANILSPYSGTWHAAADKYGKWVRSTWWDHHQAPQWIREMKSWQRVIFKHQYGNYLFKYSDLYGRMQKAGESVHADAVFAFGWWKEGMDRGNPAYTPDDSQGGDEAWRKAITKFKKSGQKLIMYYNGQLIDTNSEFYKSGEGSKISYKSPAGTEIADQYRFSGKGTWLAEYQAVTFVIADTRHQIWRDKLVGMVDRAHRNGANAVFFDQLGYGFLQKIPWDTSREFPVPDNHLLRDKGETLKYLRDYIVKTYEPDFAFGSEQLADYTGQYCDFVHIVSIKHGKENFSELFRYTFPEIVFTDRNVRDDTDIERRVNMTLLKGLCNDIEIYRCRGLIDETPKYQAYLAKVNAIRNKYSDCLMLGTFRDVKGFDNSNKAVQAKGFFGEKRVAVVATNEFEAQLLSTQISVPGYRFVDSATLGNAKVEQGGKSVSLGQYDLAVLVFEKQ